MTPEQKKAHLRMMQTLPVRTVILSGLSKETIQAVDKQKRGGRRQNVNSVWKNIPVITKQRKR